MFLLKVRIFFCFISYFWTIISLEVRALIFGSFYCIPTSMCYIQNAHFSYFFTYSENVCRNQGARSNHRPGAQEAGGATITAARTIPYRLHARRLPEPRR